MFYLNKNKRRGFSIIELLATISIIAVLSYIAFTSYATRIRQGRQVEAKHHLGLAYSRQLSYYAIGNTLNPSLKNISAVPQAGIRYNIGTDWSTASGNFNLKHTKLVHDGGSDNLCPCANGSIPTGATCFSLPTPDKKLADNSCSEANKCFGKSTDSIESQLVNIGVSSSVLQTHHSGGFEHGSTEAKFEYYAIGCTSHRLRKPADLDVWSIDHKKNLRNIKSGI